MFLNSILSSYKILDIKKQTGNILIMYPKLKKNYLNLCFLRV